MFTFLFPQQVLKRGKHLYDNVTEQQNNFSTPINNLKFYSNIISITGKRALDELK